MARNSPENAMRFEFQIHLRPVQQVTKKAGAKKESPLRQSLVLAYQIEDLFEKGKIKSLSEVAVWLHMCNARVSQIMNLCYLAPYIQTEILTSGEVSDITEYNIREIAKQVDYAKQIKLWKFLKAEG